MPEDVPVEGPGARDPRRVRRREEPDRRAADDLPRGQPEGRRALDATSRRAGHTVAWVAVARGRAAHAVDGMPAGEIAIFEPSEQSIDFVAEGDDAVRARLGGAASARARPRQLLGAHERRGAAPGRGRRSAASAASCARTARSATRGRRSRCERLEPFDHGPRRRRRRDEATDEVERRGGDLFAIRCRS